MTETRLSPEVRVLVVEDEFYLATDLRDALTAAGAEVLGPFSDAARALAAAEQTPPTVALVDINLGQGPSYVAARYLVDRQIPFAFVTGYGGASLPAEFANVARLEKPTSAAAVTALTADLVAARCA